MADAPELPRPPGPRRGIPQTFWLLFVFGLVTAGIIAMAGFAIDKGDDKDQDAARDPANAAAAELYASGMFEPQDELQLMAEQELGVIPEDADYDFPDEGEDTTDGETPTDGDGEFDGPVADLDDPEALLAAADPAAGEELFFANGCNACHGNAGEGGVGPTIAQTQLTLAQVVGQYRTPRGIMPAFGADMISDQEVAHIVIWLETQPLPDSIVEGLGTP